MKKIVYAIIALVSLFVVSSCLEGNLKELDTYNGCDITSVQGVYYRYYLETIIPVSGEKQVKQVGLSVSNSKIDAEAATCSFDVKIPSNFPEDQKANVNASNIVVVFNISTASIIEPEGNSPRLGTPGDWSVPNKYRITAANGDTKVWTVSLNLVK